MHVIVSLASYRNGPEERTYTEVLDCFVAIYEKRMRLPPFTVGGLAESM